MTGGVEAAVLDGGGGVIRNEGPGLDETEEIVMVVGGESWTRFGLAFPDASQPALKTQAPFLPRVGHKWF
jgi:hypothetical protein